VIAAAAALLLAQGPAFQPPVVWNRITLGGAASYLRAILGDPLRIVAFDSDASRVARYWLPGDNSTYVLVVERRGYVTSFDIITEATPTAPIQTVPPDPLGVRLGDTQTSIKAQHPDLQAGTDDQGMPTLMGRIGANAGAGYSFVKDRAQSIQWTTAVPKDAPELAPIAAPAGDAPSTAILDMQQNESDGVAWEYRYLAFHPCVENERWRMLKQSLVQDGTRVYDRLHVVCPSTKSERDFYFDVTNYFGKV
jgi:hypothetical protein